MKSRDFCYWLQGFFELTECPHGLSTDRTETIKRHLALVFEHEIDPSIDGGDPATKAKLDATHGSRPPRPDGPVMRC
jgi:hypothetical protein